MGEPESIESAIQKMERLKDELLAAEVKSEALRKEINRNLTRMAGDVAKTSVTPRKRDE
jgi:hypothetical protein